MFTLWDGTLNLTDLKFRCLTCIIRLEKKEDEEDHVTNDAVSLI